MQSSARAARRVALTSHLALLALILAWYAWLAQPATFPVIAALILLAGPLLLPLRGLLHGRTYTHVWTAMLALVYLLHGLIVALSVPELRLLAGAEAVLALTLYASCIGYSRLRAREAKG